MKQRSLNKESIKMGKDDNKKSNSMIIKKIAKINACLLNSIKHHDFW